MIELLILDSNNELKTRTLAGWRPVFEQLPSCAANKSKTERKDLLNLVLRAKVLKMMDRTGFLPLGLCYRLFRILCFCFLYSSGVMYPPAASLSSC